MVGGSIYWGNKAIGPRHDAHELSRGRGAVVALPERTKLVWEMEVELKKMTMRQVL